MNIEQIISGLSYLGIFILLFTNGIFSLPSSQVVYIIVGYFVTTGFLSWPLALLIGAIGNTAGNIALYEFAREHGMKAALKLLPMTEKHAANFERYFKKKGLAFLFVSKLTPTLKVFTPIFGGVGKAPRLPYTILMFIASCIWAAVFIAIGFFFGKSFQFFSGYAVALAVITLLVVIFFWYSYKKSAEEDN